MKIDKNQKQTFLVLVPHRDARGEVRKYSDSLFADGFSGVAFSFPWVAPLALLSKPLTGIELKNCARALREATLSAEGKFIASEITLSPFFAKNDDAPLVQFGLCLNLANSENIGTVFERTIKKEVISTKIVTLCLSAVICSYLLPANITVESLRVLLPSQISFRAAALANMNWQPLADKTGFKWEIEKLHWLPKK